MPVTISGTSGISQVQDNVITTSKISDNAIIQEKIATNAVVTRTLSAGAVNNEKIANSSVNAFKLDLPYIALGQTTGITFPVGWSGIPYNTVPFANRITANSSPNISFEIPGVYKATVGYRLGAGADDWTGVRVQDSNNVTRGTSYGYGGIGGNDPGPAEVSFLFRVPADRVNQLMSVQLFRSTSTQAVATPVAGQGLYAVLVTITYVGQ